MTSKVTLFVYAWDTYQPAWSVFCYGLNKYWDDCPYPLVFLTNHLEPPCGTAIKVGDENNFYRKINFALDQITSPYILFMHEDYWIKQKVNTEAIEQYIQFLDDNVADYIRLIPVPKPDYDFPQDERLGIIDEKAEFRVSFMASLWRISTLREIVKPHLSLWETEKYGPELAKGYGNRFLSVKNADNGIKYDLTAITRRYWTKAAYKYATDENIYIDFDKLPRPQRSLIQKITLPFKRVAFRIKRDLILLSRKLSS